MAPQLGTADIDVFTHSSLCLAPQWGTADSDVITQSSLCLDRQWGTADRILRSSRDLSLDHQHLEQTTCTLWSTDKAPALPPPPPEAGPSNAGKAKPAAKPKPEIKGKQAKGKDKGKKKEEEEYGNIASSRPRDEDEMEGTVYENYGFQGEGNEAAAAAQPAASGGEGSRIPNADGLLYSTVDFTKEQRQKEKDPDPLRDNRDYAGLDFAEMAEAARKMSKK
ncbi:hypothetical protein ACOMHN_035418 [Nucella lapillus]